MIGVIYLEGGIRIKKGKKIIDSLRWGGWRKLYKKETHGFGPGKWSSSFLKSLVISGVLVIV